VTLIVATTGKEGLRLASDAAPDLVLLDRRLPDMLGDDVLTSLKANPGTAGIPVVVLSGDYGAKLETKLIGLGAAELLAKPFDVLAIYTIINRFCGPPS
jgi:DNA-binding response OmpR family regulator